MVKWSECLWIRPEGFDWIWSLPSPCTCSSSHGDFPFFQPLPFWKSDYVITGHIFIWVRKMNWMFFSARLSTKMKEKTRILGIKTMLCRTHKNASPPLPTRSNWLGGFVSVTKLFSSSLCSSALHSPSFISTLLSCLLDQYWTIFAKLFCSSWSHEPPFFFQCSAVCFFSGTDALYVVIPGYLPEALECLRQSLAWGEV